MKKLIFIVTFLVSMLISAQSYSLQFEGYFYDPSTVDNYRHSIHMEFGISGYQPSDVLVISIFKGECDTSVLKERFTKFNLESDPTGKPHEGWSNFFTIYKMEPGAYYTLICSVNGKIQNIHSFKMIGLPNVIKPIQKINSLRIYPNPSKGEFTIETPFDESTVTITDTEGRIVYSNNQTSYVQRIDPYLYLSDGLYFVTLIKGKQIIEIKRLLINH